MQFYTNSLQIRHKIKLQLTLFRLANRLFSSLRTSINVIKNVHIQKDMNIDKHNMFIYIYIYIYAHSYTYPDIHV